MDKSEVVKGPDAAFLNKNCDRANGADLILQGIGAFDNIKGLTAQYLKGVFITLLIVSSLFGLEFVFIYKPYVAPFIESYVEKINNLWSLLSYITTPIAWALKLVVWFLMVMFAMKVASLFMAFWLDKLVEKVIAHYRNAPDVPFSFSTTAKNILKGLMLSLGNMIFAVIFMILGFIPIIGPIFAFIGASCSNGYDIMSPYMMILAESDEKVLKEFKITKAKTFVSGFVQTGLTFVPAVGWFALPFTLLAQVIGYTCYCEEKWQEHLKKEESS